METDTNSPQRDEIQASDILAEIERGEPVEYDGVIIELHNLVVFHTNCAFAKRGPD